MLCWNRSLAFLYKDYSIKIILYYKYVVKDSFFKISTINANPNLGRWTIHNYKETTLKIKYANEENCGISGKIIKKRNRRPLYLYNGYESAHSNKKV